GWSGLNRDTIRDRLGVNSIDVSGFHPTTAIVTWRYTPRSDLLVTNRAAFIHERYEDVNKGRAPLTTGRDGEWNWNSSVTKQWGSSAATDAGVSVRRVRADGFAQRLSAPVTLLDSYRGAATMWSGYVQQSWSISPRFRFEAGTRADSDSLSPARTMSPY